MRKLLLLALLRLVGLLGGAPGARGPARPPGVHAADLDEAAVTPNLTLAPDEAALFRQVGQIAQRVARKFGDRQNSPSELKPREAEEIVCALLNCGNLMTALADRQHPEPPRPKEPHVPPDAK